MVVFCRERLQACNRPRTKALGTIYLTPLASHIPRSPRRAAPTTAVKCGCESFGLEALLTSWEFGGHGGVHLSPKRKIPGGCESFGREALLTSWEFGGHGGSDLPEKSKFPDGAKREVDVLSYSSLGEQ